MYFNSYKYSNQHIVVTYAFIMCAVFIHPYTTAKEVRETHTACMKKDTTQASIPLNCSSNKMIHVISETFGERTSGDNCSVVYINSATKSYTSDSQGLIVTCNGHETCTEHTACSPPEECNFSRPAAEIKYECVKASGNICSEFNETESVTSLYLDSPGYPISVGVNHSCMCRVTGSAMELMVIHQRINQSFVQINVTVDNWKTWKGSINSFNKVIADSSGEIIIVYDNGGNDNQHFWTRIRGDISRTECYPLRSTSESTTDSQKCITHSPTTEGNITTADVNTQETTGNTITNSDTTPRTSRTEASVSKNVKTTDTTENNSIYSTTIQETGRPQSSPSDDINTTDTTENNSTYSDTTQGTGPPGSSPSYDSTLSSAVVIAAVFGGVVVVTVLLTITVFVCRKKRTPRKDLGDFQMDENNAYGESETEVDTVSSHHDYLEPRQLQCVESCVGGFDVELAIKGPKDQCYDVEEDTGMVTNDIYHSYQRKSEANGQQIQTENKGVDNVDSKETTEISNWNQTLNGSQNDDMHAAVRSGYGTSSDEAISVCSDEENVMVTNDLYHTYQQTKEQETSCEPASLEDDNDSIVVDNDLYKSITAKL